MPPETILDRVAICFETLRSDRRLFDYGFRETTNAVAQSRVLITQSREVLARVGKALQPDPPQKVPLQATSLRPPVCIDCRLPMHFVASQANTVHPQLRHCLFACDCGRTSDQLIAEIIPDRENNQ
jgi:hypothetical protein